MICPGCKKEIPDGKSFCTECGYKFNNVSKEKIVKKPKENFSEEVTNDWNRLIKFWFILMGLSLVTQTLNLFAFNDNNLTVLNIVSLAMAVASGIFAIVMIFKNKLNIKNAIIFGLAEVVGLFPIFASIIVSLIADEDGVSWIFDNPSIWITFGSTVPLAIVWALIFGGINQKRFGEFKTIKLSQKNKKAVIIASIVLAVVFAGMFGAIKIRKAFESAKQEKYLAELEEQDRNKYESLEGYVLTDRIGQKFYFFDDMHCFVNNYYCEYTYNYKSRISESSVDLGVGTDKAKNQLSIFVSFEKMSQEEIDLYSNDLKRALEYNEANKNSFESHTEKHSNYRFDYSATSYLTENLSSGTVYYRPSNLSSEFGTPWVPENNGNKGIGEKIVLKGQWDNHLCLALRNGFQSSTKADMYEKNARVKKLKITCSESGESLVTNVSDDKNVQYIDVRAILPQEDMGNITLVLEVMEVYNGTKYTDLCIDSIVPYFLVF